MTEAITLEVALALIAGLGIVYGWIKNHGDHDTEVLERLARLEAKLDGLAETVDRHNKVVERTFKLESDLGTAFKHIDRIRADIDKLENVKIGGTE